MRKGVSKYRLVQAQLDDLGILTSVMKTGKEEYTLVVNGEIVKVYKKRDTANLRLVKILKETKGSLPTGLYGCPCHPFRSWEEHDKFYTQKLSPGMKVKIRHSGKEGEILKKLTLGFWSIKTGPIPRDIIQEHTQNLIQLKTQSK